MKKEELASKMGGILDDYDLLCKNCHKKPALKDPKRIGASHCVGCDKKHKESTKIDYSDPHKEEKYLKIWGSNKNPFSK